jgi:hypothetical protein
MEGNWETLAEWLRFRDGPDWRWKLTTALTDRPHPALIPQGDPAVREALDYLRWQGQGPDAGLEVTPEAAARVAGALLLAQDAPSSGAAKVLVLGTCPPAEIAARLGLEEGVIVLWEQLFFEVRPFLHATSWLANRVIRPVQQKDAPLAARMKLACAGPFAARAALDAGKRVSLDPGQRLFEQRVLLSLKFEEASQVVLGTDRSKLSFMKTYHELMQRERRLRLAEQRLEAKCQRALWDQRRAEERQARKQKEQQGREAARAREQEARRQQWREARERAANSPLAQLCWAYSSETVPQAPGAAGGPDSEGITLPVCPPADVVGGGSTLNDNDANSTPVATTSTIADPGLTPACRSLPATAGVPVKSHASTLANGFEAPSVPRRCKSARHAPGRWRPGIAAR